MIRWGYIHEKRPCDKSNPIRLNRCFWAITSCPRRTRGNWDLNGAGLRPSLSGAFNGGHFCRRNDQREKKKKLVRLDWRTRLGSKWADLNYTRSPRAVALLEFVRHLQICICIGPYSHSPHTHAHTRTQTSSLYECKHLQNDLWNWRASEQLCVS